MIERGEKEEKRNRRREHDIVQEKEGGGWERRKERKKRIKNISVQERQKKKMLEREKIRRCVYYQICRSQTFLNIYKKCH